MDFNALENHLEPERPESSELIWHEQHNQVEVVVRTEGEAFLFPPISNSRETLKQICGFLGGKVKMLKVKAQSMR